MPSTRLTDRGIKAIKPPESGRVEHWDTVVTGLGLRISDTGRKAWVVMYRNQGRLRRMTLGKYPAMSLSDARTEAGDIIQLAAHGEDPAAERRARRQADTFAELADEYLERHAKPSKKSWRKDQAIIKGDLKPVLGHIKAREVARRDVIGLLDKVVARGAPIQANRILEILRKIFNWAISRDLVDINPCHGVKKPSVERSRERVLDENEIKAVWSGLDPEGGEQGAPRKVAKRTRIALRLVLATAQRPGEVAGMAWSEIDDDWETASAPVWTIPGSRTKNGRPHRVPLSPLAVDLLRSAQALADGALWAFPSPRRGLDRPEGQPVSAASLPHAVLDADGFGVKGWTPHDLRRTAGTHMTGEHCGVSRFVLERVLNHTDKSVTGVYDRYQYDREKRVALEAWGARLHAIVTGEKARPMVVNLNEHRP